MAFNKVTRDWTLAQRLAEHSKLMPNGCRIWTASVDDWGYGVLWWQHKIRKAHRLSWEDSNGFIPAGLCVLHRCDTPACINIDHLWLGTNAENNADMMKKGRHVAPRGEQNGKTNFTTRHVLAIRADTRPQRTIAAEYSTSQMTISRIKRRKTWSHV